MCENCKYWKPTYAPYVKHGYPYIMTCQRNKPDGELGGCKYWEKKDEPDNKRED